MMLELSCSPSVSGRTLLDRARDVLASCTSLAERLVVHGAGRHILLGRAGHEPFARLTALGSGSYGLSFHGGVDRRWELLLIDDLPSVIEHALIGEGALPAD